MTPGITAGVCVLIAVGIVVGVWRFVRLKNAALHQSRTSLQHEKVRADAAQAKAGTYRDTAERVIGVAEDAEANTRRALDVAGEIKKVSTQMDALMYRVANEDRPRGRHTLKRDLSEDLGFGDEMRYP
jgi:uncharacterized protein HemX